ncbi:hypothetical protein JL722_2032 [Aureococcus anophagefferens]|nr:hypothetical protein JL722_2032 [Aureococcus anophagefferens]
MRDIDDGAFALLFEANITPVDAGEFPPHGVRYLHREMNMLGEGPVKHFPKLHAKIAALYAAALRELRFEGEFCAAEDFAASSAAGLDDRACGRICPGRDLALELVVSVLQVMRAPSDDDARRLLGVGPAFDGAP